MSLNYIAIEGCIGAGKTTLTKMLAETLNAKTVYEKFEDNSFLPKFYDDPIKYAFSLEMSFLAERYHQLKNIANLDLFVNTTIADYIINKCLIFATINLPEDELNLYQSFFNITISQLPKPDLIVYLYQDISRLLYNIQLRGRTYEQNIKAEYLHKIQKGYLSLIEQNVFQNVLILDINKIDFVSNPEHFLLVEKTINTNRQQGIHRVVLE